MSTVMFTGYDMLVGMGGVVAVAVLLAVAPRWEDWLDRRRAARQSERLRREGRWAP